jgi:23S rRNA (guanosine2251-2'-O)-methyltransferase
MTPSKSRGPKGRPGQGRTSKGRPPKRRRSAPSSDRGSGPPGPPSRPNRRTGPARGLGGDQVEGRQAVRELLVAGNRRVREVLVAADQDDVESLQDIVDLALDAGTPVREISRKRLFADAHTESPQGVIARAAPLPEHDLDDLVMPKGDVVPFLVALDGVTDPGNLGALLRSAECAGVTGVILPRHRATHVTPTVTKAAAGAIEHLPMSVVGGLPSALLQLHDQAVPVIGLDGGGDRSLFDLDVAVDGPICLVLGAEGRGLSRLVRQRCDELVAIPLLGHLASLNVAAAGALACYEVARRRAAAG